MKKEKDSPPRPRGSVHHATIETLRERLTEAFNDLQAKEGGRLSWRDISRRAGFKSATHAGLIVQGRVSNPGAATIDALARVFSVDSSWLLGTSNRKRATDGVPRRQTTAIEAVRLMGFAEGIDEEFLDHWQRELELEPDMSADFLWTQLKAAWARFKRGK